VGPNSAYYKKGYKYWFDRYYVGQTSCFPEKTIITDFIVLTTDGKIYLLKGFASDGPSGPTWDTDSIMRASFEHDGIYRLIRWGLLEPRWKDAADLDYMMTCIEDCCFEFRAKGHYWSLQKWGDSSINPRNKIKVHCSPKKRRRAK